MRAIVVSTALFVALSSVLPTASVPLAAAVPAPAVDVDRSAPPDTVADWSGFLRRIHREGRVFIAGQPDSTALLALPDRGVTCVVNLRTPGEMEERVDFDEAALLDDLGVEYVRIPLGGDDFPYTPAAVDSFAAVLERHEGKVLLHCTVAGRASHLWAAYLVRNLGFDIAEAYGRGRAMGIGATPFERFLGLEMVPTPVD